MTPTALDPINLKYTNLKEQKSSDWKNLKPKKSDPKDLRPFNTYGSKSLRPLKPRTKKLKSHEPDTFKTWEQKPLRTPI